VNHLVISSNDIYNGILTLAIGVIGYFLKDYKNATKEKQKALEDEIAKVKDDLVKLATTLPLNYTLRDDFLRAITSLDMKVDTIARDVGEVSKNLSKLVGGIQKNESGT
jgi:uncharacterized membrane-anchored protein YhcB (DUF1043 family)